MELVRVGDIVFWKEGTMNDLKVFCLYSAALFSARCHGRKEDCRRTTSVIMLGVSDEMNMALL